MTIGIIIFAIILIGIFSLVGRNTIETIDEHNETESAGFGEDATLNAPDKIEEAFFSEVRNGKKKYQFLKIHNQFDLLFIKSIFQSANIPYYIEFENISRMRPGIYVGDLGNYNLLYILEEDYNDAIGIVENYLKTKRQNKNDGKMKNDNIRNLIEVLFTGWKVPSASDADGIEIMYKNGNYV